MDRDRVQAQLTSTYQRWKTSFDRRGLNLDDYSPPLLLVVTERYCRAPMKIVVYGKETAGWGWNSSNQEKYHHSQHDWRFRNQSTLRDFLENDDAIEALCWTYQQFAFANGPLRPRLNSPFWQAFREIEQWPGEGVMWSNLLRVDYKADSILYADQNQREAILRQQGAIVVDELRALAPDVCVFFTGPKYDTTLENSFGNIEFSQITGAPQRELARLRHIALPQQHSYRTYHPNYLSQSKKWGYIESIHSAITGTRP
jgi:hypothetical protein